MNKTQQQIVALAGLFQAMEAVNTLAQTGQTNQDTLETALKSLFITNPETTLSVYGNLFQLSKGLKQVHNLLEQVDNTKRLNSVRYALAIIHLESKLKKNTPMLNELAKRLERAENQTQHFGLLHENVIASIAAIYTDTISTFKLRVQVSGQESHLTIEHNAAKVRALLLSGIRAAMLWRQLGGHRWHFIFKRKALTKECSNLLKQLNLH